MGISLSCWPRGASSAKPRQLMDSIPDLDYVISFLREAEGARGRLVRLNAVADTILSRYPYPEPVARLLGELLLVAAMLGANLKQEGIFTIQLRGQGRVPLLVVDAAYGGQLRGFADIAEGASFDKPSYSPAELVGKDSYLAITFDPGEGLQRYQGVVALEGDSIIDALVNYFTYSQQLDVLFKLALEKRASGWVAGGFMLERMPGEGGTAAPTGDEAEEGWRSSLALAGTLKEEELLDPLLDGNALLYRLFHEDGVRVYPPRALTTGCRCSRARIHDLLLSMPIEDRADMVVDGSISVHCQFCNTTEKFAPDEVGLQGMQ